MMMEQELKKIMTDLLGIQEDEITDDLSTNNTENWDSLKHVELILSIEEQFGITLTADEIVAMISFAEIKHVLREKGIEI